MSSRVNPARRKPGGAENEALLEEVIAADRVRVQEALRNGPILAGPTRAPEPVVVQLSVRVPTEVRDQVRAASVELDQSVQEFVLEALRARLQRFELSREVSPALTRFAAEVLEMSQNGEYRKMIESWSDADLLSE